jgi:hypothetical protein
MGRLKRRPPFFRNNLPAKMRNQQVAAARRDNSELHSVE